MTKATAALSVVFLSTPSARRATRERFNEHYREMHFYPRPPRGGRREPMALVMVKNLFLSTPSARRATLHRVARFQAHEISIHALREEGDA